MIAVAGISYKEELTYMGTHVLPQLGAFAGGLGVAYAIAASAGFKTPAYLCSMFSSLFAVGVTGVAGESLVYLPRKAIWGLLFF